jgi:phospholipase/carboxylesterase
MNITELSTIEIKPKSNHQFSVIWLHGLGADGHDFEAIVPELILPENHGIHFIFPNADIIPVTINQGMEMRAWYDIKSMTVNREIDFESMEKSSLQVQQLIDRELEKGIPHENILLAGFSQGGVIALTSALKQEKSLAGVLALSTYFPTIERISSEKINLHKNIPLFFGHGNFDPVVPIDLGKLAVDSLEEKGFTNISWNEYFMQHSVCESEISAISQFIKDIFSL